MNPPELPLLPRDAAPCAPSGAPAFPGLWQARAFALAQHLEARGTFAWPAFSAALAAELPPGVTGGDDYWHAWLRALEALLARGRLAAPDEVTELACRWQRAAERTPHGMPIRLEAAG
ncbi:MAG TPA: nitrile hydratase accessory protein [Amaricoccus sp.]|nr:nitrile hydratase accessory protein [Amaricoccus sp.]